MIKKFKDEELNYEPKKLTFVDSETAQISGKIEASRSGVNILIKLSDDYSTNTINQLVFNTNPLYSFIEHHIGEKIPCVADIKYVTNIVGDKKYQAAEIHNIYLDVLTEEEKKAIEEKKEAEKKAHWMFVRTNIMNIENVFLKKLCAAVYKNALTYDKLKTNPATEHSAYNEVGGIMHMIADTVNLTVSTVENLNANFGEDSVKFNLDLMKAGAILCNIGRGYMLEFDENNTIIKTENNVLDNDTLIARDLIMSEIHALSTATNEDGSPAYEIDQDVVAELIHMITTSKSKIEYNPSITPRTKHAMLLADIVSMTFTKGLFEKLEIDNDCERVVKAYEGGKSYILY